MALSARLRYRTLPKILWTVGILGTVGGVVALAVTLIDAPKQERERISQVAEPSTAASGAAVNPDEIPVVRTSLPADARKIVLKFVQTAVTRENTAASYDITAPELRGDFTRAQWAKGDIPVIPYPPIGGARYQIVQATDGGFLLDVGLFPKAGSKQKAQAFRMRIKQVGAGADARWLVSYWVPYADSKVRSVD